MTTTFLAVIALTGPLAPAAKPEFQAQTDYSHALKVAADEKKPIAVLIGKGDLFAKMMGDSSLSAEAKKLLTEKYVCLTVDVDTEAGKKLAGQFQMPEAGLVISSAGGTHQALRQPGAVTAKELSQYTANYANVAAVPATTVNAGVQSAPTYYYPSTGSCPNGTCSPSIGSCPNGTCSPSTPTYSSCPSGTCPGSVIPAGYSTPYGSSCPSGTCPNSTPRFYRR